MIPGVLSDHCTTKLKIDSRQNPSKLVEIKQLTTEWWKGQRKTQEGNKNIPGTKWKWKHNTAKRLGRITSSSQGEVHSLKCVHEKYERAPVNDLIPLGNLEKQEQIKFKPSQWQKINQNQSKIQWNRNKENNSWNQNLRVGSLRKDKQNWQTIGPN